MNKENIKNFQSEVTITNTARFLWLKKKFIGITILITLVLIIGYSFIAPNQFASSATILPPEDAGSMGDLTTFLQTLSGGVSLGAGASGNKLLIYMEILKSRELAKTVVEITGLDKKLKVSPDNLEELYAGVLGMINVEMKRSGIIVITSVTSTKYFPSSKDKIDAAVLSADILNNSIIALDKINREKNTSKARRKRLYIEKSLASKNAELDSLDTVIENYRKANKLYSLDEQSTAIITNAISIGSELAKAELDLNLKQLEFENSSPIIKSAKEKYKSLYQQYQRIQGGGIAKKDEFSIPLQEVPRLMKEYSNLIRDQKIIEQVKLYLETQKYQEAIQEESDVPTVETLDQAQVPKHRISPNRKVMLILGFFVSLVGASIFVIVHGVFRQNLIFRKEENTDIIQ